MKYAIIPASEVKNREIFSFWQSENWKNILDTSGQARETFYFGDSQSIVLVEIRSVGFGLFAAFSLGVTSVQLGESDEKIFFDELYCVLRDKGYIFYQIEPLDDIKISQKSGKIYKKFLTPYTRVLDLTLSEEAIFSDMHEKGRYNTRLAEKHGVEIFSVEPTKENIDIWMNLLTETTTRDHFFHNHRLYYEIFINEMYHSQRGELLFAKFEGHIIAASIVVYTQSRAIYYYGASTSQKDLRKHMAPYLLQWYAIREAKRRGILLYDFLGIAEPGNSMDSLKSVSEFKEKFGGTIVALPQKYIFPLSFVGRVFLWFRKVLKKGI